MNANENNNTINQEVYDGVKEVMLQEGVIPREVIKYSKEMQEEKRLEELKNKWGFASSITGTAKNIVESMDKQYPNS